MSSDGEGRTGNESEGKKAMDKRSAMEMVNEHLGN